MIENDYRVCTYAVCAPWRFKSKDLEAIFYLAFLRESMARFIPVGRIFLPVVGIIDGLVLYIQFSESQVWSQWQSVIFLVIRPIQVLGINMLVFYADQIEGKYHVGLGVLLLWSYRIFIIYFIAQDLELETHHPAHLLIHTIWTPVGAATIVPSFEEHIIGALAIVAAKPVFYLVGVHCCFDAGAFLELCVRFVIAFIGIYLNFEVHGRRREDWISSSR